VPNRPGRRRRRRRRRGRGARGEFWRIKHGRARPRLFVGEPNASCVQLTLVRPPVASRGVKAAGWQASGAVSATPFGAAANAKCPLWKGMQLKLHSALEVRTALSLTRLAPRQGPPDGRTAHFRGCLGPLKLAWCCIGAHATRDWFAACGQLAWRPPQPTKAIQRVTAPSLLAPPFIQARQPDTTRSLSHSAFLIYSLPRPRIALFRAASPPDSLGFVSLFFRPSLAFSA
jgi:hypothetical protein